MAIHLGDAVLFQGKMMPFHQATYLGGRGVKVLLLTALPVVADWL